MSWSLMHNNEALPLYKVFRHPILPGNISHPVYCIIPRCDSCGVITSLGLNLGYLCGFLSPHAALLNRRNRSESWVDCKQGAEEVWNESFVFGGGGGGRGGG